MLKNALLANVGFPIAGVFWNISNIFYVKFTCSKVGLKIREANNGVGGKRLVTFDIENPIAVEKERPVQSQLPWYAYSSFLDWIEMQKTKGKYKKVMLLASNNMAMPALLNKL